MIDFAEVLDGLSQSGNLRSIPDISHLNNSVVSGDNVMLNLSSNDYLGIASDMTSNNMMKVFLDEICRGDMSASPEEVLSATRRLSSTSSRLLTGTGETYRILEEFIAELFGRECALTFSSGYHMNIGILPAVCDSDTLILADKLVHASIIDGIRLSTAKSVRFRHQDLQQLEALVERYHKSYGRIIIVTESIFSMDGDVTDLRVLSDIKKRYPGVMLYVDEAHAIGVRGETGLGIAQEQGVIADVDFLCGTFGKAIASMGAYVVCDKVIRDFLVNRMRSLIFTTALPPVNVLWTLRVMQNIGKMTKERKRLAENSAAVRDALRAEGLSCPSDSHIIPVMVGDSARAVVMAKKLQQKGLYLLPVRPPTVPEGTSRLRISMTADFDQKDVDKIVANILGVLREDRI